MNKSNNFNCYKQSGKFSWAGAGLMLLSTAVIGTALFVVYLLFNHFCSLIYLQIVAAVLISILLGFIIGKIIGKFKMRNTLVTVICVSIGFLIATYAKWAIYDYWDVKNNFYEPMQQYSAYEYYGFSYIFDDSTNFEDAYNALHDMKNVENIETTDEEENSIGYSRGSDTVVSDESIWEAGGFDDLLGTTVEEAKASVEKSKDLNAYDFTFEYRGVKKITFTNLLTSPHDLWEDIVDINRTGRWSYKSSSVTDGTPVKGVVLWIVWCGEFLTLASFMLLSAVRKSKLPFIEKEDDWAYYSSMKRIYRFAPPSDNVNELKEMLSQNPQSLFTSPLPSDAKSPLYIGVETYTSKDKTENYINCILLKYLSKKQTFEEKVIVNYMQCDRDFIERLENTFLGQLNK